MTIDIKCAVCKQPLLRKLIELGYNAGMTPVELSTAIHGDVSTAVVTKHLKQHAEGSSGRSIPVLITPMRERVYDIQRLQVEEIERRVELAQQAAELWNATQLNVQGFESRDWSYYFDILGKDIQAAVGSILKTQGIADKRDKSQGELKLGLFEAMVGAGLAPKSISGDKMPALQSGDENEVDDGWQERGGDDE